ncbi:glycoside hydrolase [Niabella sp. W65]|nr:glycoside hydrolase [Niabella sp. W65]MCH7366662.1 glycoside hydrolase [Niabella sp. W65]
MMNRNRVIQVVVGVLLSHCFLYALACSGKEGQIETGKDKQIEPVTDTSAIQWDKSTLVKVAAPPQGKPYAGYARLVELNDSKLLCVYEADGSIWQVMSNDYGKTWQGAKIIAEREPN